MLGFPSSRDCDRGEFRIFQMGGYCDSGEESWQKSVRGPGCDISNG
jgi:hypothetical protein